MILSAKQSRISRAWAVYLALACVVAWLVWTGATLGPSALFDRISNFTTVLLGIFIEASPFLLLGSLGSGIVEVFFQDENFSRRVPKNPFLGAMTGAIMGFVFPVCECGVVPLTRRLFRKGLPVPVGIAFLLGAPALNPIVIISTLVAFGWGPIFFGRIILTFIIATITGFLFSLQKDPASLLNRIKPDLFYLETADEEAPKLAGVKAKIQRVFTIAVDEFFEIGRYLVLGASLAGILQTLVKQNALLALSQGPVISVLILMLLAVLLSVCSTVDAFIALSFAGSFTTGAVLSFLVFGPMVDIKSTLMFLHVFQRKTVAYMILIPLLLTILFTIFINLNIIL